MEENSKELTVVSYSKKGYGIAFDEKKNKVEIPNTIVGEVVLAHLNKKRKNLIKARLIEIKQRASERVFQRCEHFEMCGGCKLQMLDYTAQLKHKQEQVEKWFSPFNVKTLPIMASPEIFEYRNKMEFSFSENRAGEKFLGLMIKCANKYVFNLHRCHLAGKWFSDIVNIVRDWQKENSISAYIPWLNRGLLRTLMLRESKNTQERMILLTISNKENFTSEYRESLIKKIKEYDERINLILRLQDAKAGEPTIFLEEVLQGRDHIFEKMQFLDSSLQFKISASSFFQPNTAQAEKIYNYALSLADIKEDSVVFDLYSGTGTLGMIFAKKAKKVIGIEINKDAVFDAEENRKINRIDNFSVIEGDVGTVLSSIKEGPDIVIIDPPRIGLTEEGIINLIKANPRQIIYISCEPENQARDIFALQEKFEIRSVQPFDQFAHTAHIENVVLLKRKD